MKNHFQNARHVFTETDPSRIPASRAEVAFVGRSNAGKSALLCALTKNNKLAAVSKTPGRTRSVNVYEVAYGKWLIDLPGYGYAEASERQRDYWPKMIALTLAGRPTMARVYVLLDAERGVMPIDQTMIGWLRENKIPLVLVGTKVDRLGQTKQIQARTEMAKGAGFFPNEIFWVSAKKGYGMREFEKDVAEVLGLI